MIIFLAIVFLLATIFLIFKSTSSLKSKKYKSFKYFLILLVISSVLSIFSIFKIIDNRVTGSENDQGNYFTSSECVSISEKINKTGAYIPSNQEINKIECKSESVIWPESIDDFYIYGQSNLNYLNQIIQKNNLILDELDEFFLHSRDTGWYISGMDEEMTGYLSDYSTSKMKFYFGKIQNINTFLAVGPNESGKHKILLRITVS